MALLGGGKHMSTKINVKAGLYRNANAACENDAYVNVGKFVDCSVFAVAANRPYINVLYANSLSCTDSRRIAFGCSLNVRHTAACCLPCLGNTSTSNRMFASFSNAAFVFCSCSDVNSALSSVHTCDSNVIQPQFEPIWGDDWSPLTTSNCGRVAPESRLNRECMNRALEMKVKKRDKATYEPPHVKPGLHRNMNRTRTQHLKTMWMINSM